MVGNVVATTLVVGGWGYLIYTGNISTIWPLFGTGNQLLATIALAVTTTFLVNMGKARYAWMTGAPMLFVGVTTLTAAVESIQKIFWPLTRTPDKAFQGYLDTGLMLVFIAGVLIVTADAAKLPAVMRRKFVSPEAEGILSGATSCRLIVIIATKNVPMPRPCTSSGEANAQKSAPVVYPARMKYEIANATNEKVAIARASILPISLPTIGEISTAITPLGAAIMPAQVAV